VPELSVRILVTVKVPLRKERETLTTEKDSILKLVTEDAMLETLKSFNAESTVDQTIMTTLLKLLLHAQANHGLQNGKELVVNSNTLLTASSTEEEETTSGDH
jgi:hypothetical protein